MMAMWPSIKVTCSGFVRDLVQWVGDHRKASLCFMAVSGCVAVYWTHRQRDNLPPGPLALPLWGPTFAPTEDFHLDCMQLAKKYGDVFSVRVGQK